MISMKRFIAGVALAAATVAFMPSIALAAHDFVLTNKSSHTIKAVYLSNVGDDTWGPNQLDGGETIAPGAKQTWSIPAAECKQDVKIDWDDGQNDVMKNVDTCSDDVDADH